MQGKGFQKAGKRGGKSKLLHICFGTGSCRAAIDGTLTLRRVVGSWNHSETGQDRHMSELINRPFRRFINGVGQKPQQKYKVF